VPEGLSPVKFVLAAPGASEVAVIGSFNGWNAAGWTMRRDTASGLWTLKAALPPGSHEYVFPHRRGHDRDRRRRGPERRRRVRQPHNSVLLVKNGDGSLL
jgi:1,4-alpha-glucan branching enzyme